MSQQPIQKTNPKGCLYGKRGYNNRYRECEDTKLIGGGKGVQGVEWGSGVCLPCAKPQVCFLGLEKIFLNLK